MSQWLSAGLESLSSVTNQLSELTQEVLREGVSEVKEPEDEVECLGKEVTTLKDTVEDLNAQIDSLKQCNLTLKEKNDSLELQLLRSAGIAQGSSQTSGNGNGNGWTEIDDEGSFVARADSQEDPADSSPTYSLSFKCSRLEDEVKTLKAECSHWKSLAVASNQESSSSSPPSTSEQIIQTVAAPPVQDEDRQGGHFPHGLMHLFAPERNKDGPESSSVASITDVAIGKLDHVREFLSSELDSKSNVSQQLQNTREENTELKRIIAKLNSLTSESEDRYSEDAPPLSPESARGVSPSPDGDDGLVIVTSQAALAERRVKNLIQQNASLKEALEELDHQNQVAVQQMIVTRDKALGDLKSVTKQLAELRAEHHSAKANCAKAEAHLLELKQQIEDLRSVIPETIADDKMSLADCTEPDIRWHIGLVALAKHSFREMMEEKQSKCIGLTELERRHLEEMALLTEAKNSASEQVDILTKQIEELRQRELESAVTTDVYLTSFTAGDDQNGSTNTETYNAECQTDFGSNESFELMNDSATSATLLSATTSPGPRDDSPPLIKSITPSPITIASGDESRIRTSLDESHIGTSREVSSTSSTGAIEELNRRNADLQRQVDDLMESADQTSVAVALLRQKSVDAADLNANIADQLAACQEELVERNATIDQLQAKIDDLTRQNEDSQRLVEESHAASNEIDNVGQIPMGSASDNLEEISRLKEISEQLSAEKDKLSSELSLLGEAKKDSDSNLAKVRSALEVALTESQTSRDQLNVKLMEFESQRLAMQQEFAEQKQALQAEVDQLQQRDQQLTDTVAQLTNDCQHKSSELDSAGRKISDLEDQLRRLSEMHDSVSVEEKQIGELKAQLMQATMELEIESQKMRSVTQDNASLKMDLEQKSSELAECSQKLSALELEIANLNHQVEQLAASKTEATSLADEKSQLVTLVGQKHEESVRYHQELMRITEAYNAVLQSQSCHQQQNSEETNQLANQLREAKDEVSELKSSLETSQSASRTLGDQLDQIQGQIILVQSERTDLADMNDTLKAELDMIKNEMRSAGNNESKSSTELLRLRQHLVQVEESYTCEAVKTAERERQLRERVEHLEEQLLSCTTSADGSRHQLEDRLKDMETEMESMATQRDQAKLELSSVQDKHEKTAKSLHDLQSVLQHFQQERDTSVFAEVERYKRQLNTLREENSSLLQKSDELEHQLEESQEKLVSNSSITEQLTARDGQMRLLAEKVTSYEEEISGLHRKISAAQQIQDGKIDKDVIKNLFIGYLCSPADKKPEIAHLLGCVLGFKEAEFEKTTGASASSGWLSFLGGGLSTAVSSAQHESLTRAFVNFLEKESTPKPLVQALPLDTSTIGGSSGYHLPSSSHSSIGGSREGRASIGSSRSSTPHYSHQPSSMIGGEGGDYQRHDPMSLPTDLNLPTFKSAMPSLDSGGGSLLSSNDFVKQALQS